MYVTNLVTNLIYPVERQAAGPKTFHQIHSMKIIKYTVCIVASINE